MPAEASPARASLFLPLLSEASDPNCHLRLSPRPVPSPLSPSQEAPHEGSCLSYFSWAYASQRPKQTLPPRRPNSASLIFTKASGVSREELILSKAKRPAVGSSDRIFSIKEKWVRVQSVLGLSCSFLSRPHCSPTPALSLARA